MSDIETTTDTPPGAKKKGKGRKKKGQMSVPGTERKEITELTEKNEERLAACRERLAAHAREQAAAKDLKVLMEKHAEAGNLHANDKGTRFLYRYDDDEGMTRDVSLVRTVTEKVELRFGERAAEGDDE